MTPISQNFPQYTSLHTTHFHLQFDDTAAAGLSPFLIQFFSGGLESFFIALCRLNLSWRRAPLTSQTLSPPPILISVSIQCTHLFLFKCRFRWPRLHSCHARTLPSNHYYHHLQRLRPPFRHRALPIVFCFPSLFTLVLVPKARFPVNFLSITNPVGRESLSSAPYNEMGAPNSYVMDNVSDNEYGTGGSFNDSSGLGGAHLFHPLPRFLNTITSRPSKLDAKRSATQAVMGKPTTTNNFVTKLYQYATAVGRSHFELTRTDGCEVLTLYNVDRTRYKVCYTLPFWGY